MRSFINFTLHQILMIKPRRMSRGHVARMEEMRNAYKFSIRKSEGKRSLGRSRCRWEDNNTMDLREMGWDAVECIRLAQNRDE